MSTEHYHKKDFSQKAQYLFQGSSRRIQSIYKKHKTQKLLLTGLSGLDLASTYIGLQIPTIHEGNGIASNLLLHFGFMGLIALKAATTSADIALADRVHNVIVKRVAKRKGAEKAEKVATTMVDIAMWISSVGVFAACALNILQTAYEL